MRLHELHNILTAANGGMQSRVTAGHFLAFVIHLFAAYLVKLIMQILSLLTVLGLNPKSYSKRRS